jgi:hypothetical protein
MVERSAKELGHETRDVRVRVVVWFAAILIVSVAVILFATAGLFYFFKHEHPSPAASRISQQPRVLAPAPRLQTDPTADFERFEAAEKAKLHSYGWIDKPAGVIRIPIERAMDLIAERGLPTRGPGTQDASGKTPLQMQAEKAATKP